MEDLDVLFVDDKGKVMDEDAVEQWEDVIESLEDAGDLGTEMEAKTVGEFYERALEEKIKDDEFEDIRENVQAFKDFYHR